MAKPIRVCFVSLYAYHFFNPESKSRFGGAELQLYLLAKELSKDPGFEVSFVVGDFGQPDTEIRDGIKLYKFYPSNRGIKYTKTFIAILKLWRILYQSKADVYIQRAAGAETGLVAVFCKILGKNFVYMVAHDSDLNPNKPKWVTGVRGAVRWFMFRVGLKSAKVIYVQHANQLAALKQNYNKQGLIRPSAHYVKADVDAMSKTGVLWVARCEDWKQPEVFVALAKHFPQLKFTMVMPLANDLEFFNKMKIEIGSAPNIAYFDFVPINKIDSFFEAAQVFVNTSSQEGFPNTFIQAAKAKTPILSLNINPDGMLEKNDMGICTNGNFEKMQEALQLLLSDNKLRYKMCENGYRFAYENHNIEKIILDDKQTIRNLIVNS